MRTKNTALTPSNLTKQSRGLIRSLNRSFVRDEKAPQVVRKTSQPAAATTCARCGATFLRKTWRHDHNLTDAVLQLRSWGICPACDQVGSLEGQGRLIIRGAGVAAKRDLIQRRIQNVAKQAMKTQPERRLVSIDRVDSGGDALEVLTTSQKLAHRIAHELKKVMGGRTSYTWSDDGTLFAEWELEPAKRKARKAK